VRKGEVNYEVDSERWSEIIGSKSTTFNNLAVGNFWFVSLSCKRKWKVMRQVVCMSVRLNKIRGEVFLFDREEGAEGI